MEIVTTTAIIHGGFYFLTGIWPIMSIGTFQKITGPKNDLWLVKTVGALLCVIGASLMFAGYNEDIVPAIIILAAGSAFVLAAVDVIYVTKRIIAPIYLLDAFVELLLIAWWLFVIAKF